MTTNNSNVLPIGVFDSGMGGLTVLKSLIQALPNESFIYLGDTARLPYGTKSKETVCRYAHQAVERLMEQKVKMIVIACNSATVSALEYLKETFGDIPIIGVVEPGATALANATQSNHIGIMATERTILSGCYEQTLKGINSNLVIHSKPCNIFVSLAEENHINDDIAKIVIKQYFDDLMLSNKMIDSILLGCTHFPVFHNLIKEFLPENISIVDSADCTSQYTYNLLTQQNLHNTGGTRFIKYFVTDGPERFKRIGQIFLGRTIDDINLID